MSKQAKMGILYNREPLDYFTIGRKGTLLSIRKAIDKVLQSHPTESDISIHYEIDSFSENDEDEIGFHLCTLRLETPEEARRRVEYHQGYKRLTDWINDETNQSMLKALNLDIDELKNSFGK